MSTEIKNQQQDKHEAANELDMNQLDEVAGGRKTLPTASKPKPIIGDPCAGGE